MNKSQIALIIVAAAALCAGIGCGNGESSSDGGTDGASVASASAVMDILNSNCMPCHAGAEAKEELALDTIGGLMAGGEHGPVVVAGDAAGSTIIKALRGDGVEQMPFMKDALAESDIKLIEEWINAGAATS